ncbi:hypothetical protein D3C71_1981590 [compost metagenome]
MRVGVDLHGDALHIPDVEACDRLAHGVAVGIDAFQFDYGCEANDLGSSGKGHGRRIEGQACWERA